MPNRISTMPNIKHLLPMSKLDLIKGVCTPLTQVCNNIELNFASKSEIESSFNIINNKSNITNNILTSNNSNTDIANNISSSNVSKYTDSISHIMNMLIVCTILLILLVIILLIVLVVSTLLILIVPVILIEYYHPTVMLIYLIT